MPTPILTWALVALLAPAAAAIILAVLPALRKRGTLTSALTIFAAATSFASALAVLFLGPGGPADGVTLSVPWLFSAGRPLVEAGVRVDGVSASMLAVVSFVALCVQVFSVGYMADEDEPARGRYFTYHSLFLFSMNLLVLAPNLLQLFVGWELVGATSYLLIGFYYKKPSAARAAVKAFWVTKFADSGLLLALVVLRGITGGFSWEVTLAPAAATLVTLLLFAAVVGKSAQFPLHVWLPDAMEGPTPVSALLHAATMVAAGVFLIVRADPLFAQAPVTQEIMAWVGGITALFAALLALAQTDIKKVLAYSTCSQLGYMVAGLGAGSLVGGYFHLTTHAFFKALLFLAAGSVIHAVHSNEISKMGGLRKKMPLTTAVFIIGSLALAGIPGFSGFFSKDLVLEALVEAKLWGPALFLFAGAFLTAFYMGRVVLLAFFGKESHAAEHAHESGRSMALPLVLLAIPSLAAGFFGGDLARLAGREYHFHLGSAGIAGSLLAFAGFGAAWFVYGRGTVPAFASSALRPLEAAVASNMVDRFYVLAYRRAMMGVANVAGWVDRYIVDALVNVVGTAFLAGGRRLRTVQTGNVQDYLFVLSVGVIALAAWGLWR